jgi:hypothetical protein
MKIQSLAAFVVACWSAIPLGAGAEECKTFFERTNTTYDLACNAYQKGCKGWWDKRFVSYQGSPLVQCSWAKKGANTGPAILCGGKVYTTDGSSIIDKSGRRWEGRTLDYKYEHECKKISPDKYLAVTRFTMQQQLPGHPDVQWTYLKQEETLLRALVPQF